MNLRRPIFLRRVQGVSMSPSLEPGRLVVASSVPTVRKSDVIIAKPSNTSEVIKRLVSIDDDRVQLEGDKTHPAHNISLDRTRILGKVIYPFRP